MNEIKRIAPDTTVLRCLQDVVDLDLAQNFVELGLVVSVTRRETTIDVSLEEHSERSVVQAVLAALTTAFPDVAVVNFVRIWKPTK